VRTYPMAQRYVPRNMADASIELSGEGELLALASVDMRQAAAAARLWWLRAD